MKQAKGPKTKIIELPDLTLRKQVKRLQNQISRLKRELRFMEEDCALAIQRRDALEADFIALKDKYAELKRTFYQQLNEKIQDSFDRRTTIAESQAEQALTLSIRYRDLLLERKRPVAIGIGQEYKRQARRQAEKVKLKRECDAFKARNRAQ